MRTLITTAVMAMILIGLNLRYFQVNGVGIETGVMAVICSILVVLMAQWLLSNMYTWKALP